MTQRNAIILAAGKGTRMKSVKNKVMHELIDRPILAYTAQALEEAGASRILIVAGYQAQSLMDAFPQYEFALQKEQLGTGHAVMQATALQDADGLTLVVNGDVPALKAETLKNLYEAGKEHSLVLLSAILEDGAHYGRVVREENGQVAAIVEAKDCSPDQKQIREINAGVYCFNNRDLFDSLSEMTTDNAQHEYYLTDLVKILRSKGKSVAALPAEDPNEMAGINTVGELAEVGAWLNDNTVRYWLEQGVQIVDPKRTVIGKDVKIGHDVILYPDTELLGKTEIGSFSEIYPHTWIRDSKIGENCRIQSCVLEGCTVEDGSSLTMKAMKEGTEIQA